MPCKAKGPVLEPDWANATTFLQVRSGAYWHCPFLYACDPVHPIAGVQSNAGRGIS